MKEDRKKKRKIQKLPKIIYVKKVFIYFIEVFFICAIATTQKITVDDVLQLNDATDNFLIGIEKNIYDIEFTRFILGRSTENLYIYVYMYIYNVKEIHQVCHIQYVAYYITSSSLTVSFWYVMHVKEP